MTGDHQNSSERTGSTSEGNLELFFDLVFTFTMSQVTELMLRDPSPRGSMTTHTRSVEQPADARKVKRRFERHDTDRRMMSHTRRLSGRKIAVLAADGFEKVELVVPRRALQLAGAKVDIVSLRKGRIRGVNLHMPASRVGVDKVVTDADPDAYDGLLLPGELIHQPRSPAAVGSGAGFRRAFDHNGKPIVTLCHGPWVLASAGVLTGRTLTSWPGIRDDLINAGATWLDREVVRDRNLLTSRGPQDLRAFVPAMLDILAEPMSHLRAVSDHAASDPPLENPLGWTLAALRWSPKPSAAALTGVAAAALAPPLRRRVSIRNEERPSRFRARRPSA